MPAFAILGGIGTFVSWLVTMFLHSSDDVAPVGLIWLMLGMVVYVAYRRSQHLPLTRDGAGAARADRARRWRWSTARS